LHDLVRESCGNAFLTEELTRLQTIFRAFRDVTWDLELARHDYHRIAVEAAEHHAICAAILTRDPRSATRAMAAHIRSGVTYWTQVTANLTDLPGEEAAPGTRPQREPIQ
jgi:DNA-binding GntR family transcriptional regulator